MVDNYRNLTRKSVALLNWVHSNCPGVDFFLKIDDDCYSNVHNLADILTILSPNKISVYGSLAINITDYTYRLPDGMKLQFSIFHYFTIKCRVSNPSQLNGC